MQDEDLGCAEEMGVVQLSVADVLGVDEATT